MSRKSYYLCNHLKLPKKQTMKKILAILAISATFAACNNAAETTAAATDTAAKSLEAAAASIDTAASKLADTAHHAVDTVVVKIDTAAKKK